MTPNDDGDEDGGANGSQNYPVIHSAVHVAGTTEVSGTLNSLPSTSFEIELFDNPVCNASGNGEGLSFVASVTVTTDGTGNATFDAVVPGTLNVVTATATDPLGNTSEFSQCRTAGANLNSFEIADATALEGSQAGVLTFWITLNPAAAITTTVDYASADGTATAGIDYTAVAGTLTFAPGETMQSITVPLLDDDLAEVDDETLFVDLSGATNALIGDARGVGTIVDDDPTAFSVSDVQVIEGELAIFTITLNRAASTPLSILYDTQDATAVAPDDYTATSGSLTFAAGETMATVSVQTHSDEVLDHRERFQLVLSGGLVNDQFGVATIHDPNAIPPIPTLSQWMLIALAAALAVAGALLSRGGS